MLRHSQHPLALPPAIKPPRTTARQRRTTQLKRRARTAKTGRSRRNSRSRGQLCSDRSDRGRAEQCTEVQVSARAEGRPAESAESTESEKTTGQQQYQSVTQCDGTLQ